MHLATMSGVSLAFIQKIEGGKANPSLEVITKLLDQFGVSLELTLEPPDLSVLYALGVPIVAPKRSKLRPTKDIARSMLIKSCLYLRAHTDQRLQLAVEAWLLAIKMEFPNFFKKELASPLTKLFLPKEITEQHIKLKRIATETIAAYL